MEDLWFSYGSRMHSVLVTSVEELDGSFKLRNCLQLRFTVPVLLKHDAKYAEGTQLAISSQLVTSAGKEQKNLQLTVGEKAEQTVGTVSPKRGS